MKNCKIATIIKRFFPALFASIFLLFHVASTAPAGAADPASPDVVLFLIGDAGKPEKPSDPVFSALKSEVDRTRRENSRSQVVVAYLGDNIYDHGMPEKDSREYAKAEYALMAQVAVLGPGDAEGMAPVRGIFIPGNHDWDRGYAGGWEAVRRQDARVSEIAEEWEVDVVMLPHDGCPGPEVVDAGDSLRLIIFDTQWWLHRGPKPLGPDSGCTTESERGLLDKIDEAMRGAGDRLVVVLAHHPMVSGGPHGGHLFSRELIWPPYNLVYYPYRKMKKPLQDTASKEYSGMIKDLRAVYAQHPPMIVASGHDHTLQVIQGKAPRYQLVSGAGSKSRAVGKVPEGDFSSLYWNEGKGFMRLDVEQDGRVRLGVFVVDRKGVMKEDFHLWFENIGK